MDAAAAVQITSECHVTATEVKVKYCIVCAVPCNRGFTMHYIPAYLAALWWTSYMNVFFLVASRSWNIGVLCRCAHSPSVRPQMFRGNDIALRTAPSLLTAPLCLPLLPVKTRLKSPFAQVYFYLQKLLVLKVNRKWRKILRSIENTSPALFLTHLLDTHLPLFHPPFPTHYDLDQLQRTSGKPIADIPKWCFPAWVQIHFLLLYTICPTFFGFNTLSTMLF